MNLRSLVRIRILTWNDELYPPRLKEIEQPPPVLYVRGEILPEDHFAVAIVGTSLTPIIIERMTDHGFRQWTRAIILTVSAIYLVRGAWLFWRGGNV